MITTIRKHYAQEKTGQEGNTTKIKVCLSMGKVLLFILTPQIF